MNWRRLRELEVGVEWVRVWIFITFFISHFPFFIFHILEFDGPGDGLVLSEVSGDCFTEMVGPTHLGPINSNSGLDFVKS